MYGMSCCVCIAMPQGEFPLKQRTIRLLQVHFVQMRAEEEKDYQPSKVGNV